MRTKALLALVVAVTACSAEPLGHKWKVDQDGKPIPSTKVPIWTEAEAVEVRQQAISFLIFYNIDCDNVRTPMPGEVLLFDGTNFTGECRALGTSMAPNNNSIISFDDPTAKWTSGKSWNDEVGSIRARQWGSVGPNVVRMCIRLRQNVAGSDGPGWGPAEFTMGPDGTFDRPNTSPFGDASFMVARSQPENEATCPL